MTNCNQRGLAIHTVNSLLAAKCVSQLHMQIQTLVHECLAIKNSA